MDTQARAWGSSRQRRWGRHFGDTVYRFDAKSIEDAGDHKFKIERLAKVTALSLPSSAVTDEIGIGASVAGPFSGRPTHQQSGMPEPPSQPAGPPPGPLPGVFTLADLEPHIAAIAGAPGELRSAAAGLTPAQLDTPYRNWTLRQIIHHLPDSHCNCYIRFMWALTEETPRIKAYDESRWSALPISRTGEIGPALDLFEAIHAKWVALMRSMSVEQFGRSFEHPETDRLVRLADAAPSYAWHARHHTAMIHWRRRTEGWG